MIKSVKSLFPLFILLMSVYLQQYRGTFCKSISVTSVKSSNCFIAEKKQHTILFNTKEENKHNHITDIEEKENEVVSFKKYSSFSPNIYTPFYTQLSDCLFQYTQIHLFFFKHFSYYPSSKSLYLLFEVIRI